LKNTHNAIRIFAHRRTQTPTDRAHHWLGP